MDKSNKPGGTPSRQVAAIIVAIGIAGPIALTLQQDDPLMLIFFLILTGLLVLLTLMVQD